MKLYTLEEAAYKLWLSGRDAVKEVLELTLHPCYDKTYLTLSVFFAPENPVKLSTYKISHDEDGFIVLDTVQNNVTLPGLFDIYLRKPPSMNEIFGSNKPEDDMWPYEKGCYSLNSNEKQGRYVILIQNNNQYYLPGTWKEKSIEVSDLIVTGKNLKYYAKQNLITLRNLPSEENLELYAEERGITLGPESGGKDMDPECCPLREAAADLGVSAEVIFKLILSPGVVDERLFPYVYLRDIEMSKTGQTGSERLTGFFEVEGIERMPRNAMGNFILSFGGKYRLLLHSQGATYFLAESVEVPAEHLLISAEDVAKIKDRLQRTCPPLTCGSKSELESSGCSSMTSDESMNLSEVLNIHGKEEYRSRLALWIKNYAAARSEMDDNQLLHELIKIIRIPALAAGIVFYPWMKHDTKNEKDAVESYVWRRARNGVKPKTERKI